MIRSMLSLLSSFKYVSSKNIHLLLVWSEEPWALLGEETS